MQSLGVVPGTRQHTWQTLSVIETFPPAHLYQLLLHHQSPQSPVMDLVTVNILWMFKLRLETVIMNTAHKSTVQWWAGSSSVPGWFVCSAQFLILWQPSPQLVYTGAGQGPKRE